MKSVGAGYAGFYRWELLEGRYSLAVLFEYAGTLGLVPQGRFVESMYPLWKLFAEVVGGAF